MLENVASCRCTSIVVISIEGKSLSTSFYISSPVTHIFPLLECDALWGEKSRKLGNRE